MRHTGECVCMCSSRSGDGKLKAGPSLAPRWLLFLKPQPRTPVCLFNTVKTFVYLSSGEWSEWSVASAKSMPCINCVLFSLLLQPPISDGYWPELACRSWWWFWYIYTLLPQLSIWLVWWVCMMGKISLHPHLLLGCDKVHVHRTKWPRRVIYLFSFPKSLEYFWSMNVPCW